MDRDRARQHGGVLRWTQGAHHAASQARLWVLALLCLLLAGGAPSGAATATAVEPHPRPGASGRGPLESIVMAVRASKRSHGDECLTVPLRGTAPLLAVVGRGDGQPVQKKQKQPSTAQNAVAGAIAGFTARMAVAPVDLAKIRLQVQQGRVSAASSLKYRGMIGTMRTVAMEEGFLALWKGNVPAQLMVMTFVAIKFSAFNACRNLLDTVAVKASGSSPEEKRLRGTVTNLMAGGMAGAMATTGSYPMDVLRTRLAAQTTQVTAALRTEVANVWAGGGALGFYKGIGPSLMAIVPYMAIQVYHVTYVCVYIHTYMHTCIHTYMHTYMHACIHTYMHAYIHTYKHTYIALFVSKAQQPQ